MLASRNAWSLPGVGGWVQDAQGQGCDGVHGRQLLAAAGAGEHHGLGAGLRVCSDTFQGLVQRAEAQRGAAGHDYRRRVGAGGDGRLQLAHLLPGRDQARVGHVELAGHEIVLYFNGGHARRFHLSHGARHVDRVAEPVLGVHHQRNVGDASDAAAVVHHVGHVGQHAVRHAQVGRLAHGTRKHADLVAQHVGDAGRQRVEYVGGQRAMRTGDYLPEQFSGAGHGSPLNLLSAG